MSNAQRSNSVNWPNFFEKGMDELFGYSNEKVQRCTDRVHTPLSIWSEDENVYIQLDIPGVARESLDVSVHEGVLNIQGERKQDEEDRNYSYQETHYGKFHRAVRLTDEVDEESVSADLKDGVLKISLSKKATAQPKKIEVKIE